MKRFKHFSIVMVSITSSILVLTNCINKQAEKVIITNFNGERFAGSFTCKNCHQSICDSFLLTPHYLTSRPTAKQHIKGEFHSGKNIFIYNLSYQIAMEDRDSGLFQVEYYHGVEKKARRFDIIVGSGTRGQSYLYWQGNQLFQLPVSYFTPAHTWSNSPGYPPYEPYFNRNISEQCLGCHSTYFKKTSVKSPGVEEYDHKQIIYGIDCERCHGPGAKHVEYQTQHPEEKRGKFIINPAVFTRQQKLDMCALCHSGIWNMNKSAFSFIPGDTLSKFISFSKSLFDTSEIDVHGNEYGLLVASKCYKMTNILECNTCHNIHENQRGDLQLFSQKCMNCHNNEHGNFCKMAPSIGKSITENCISCHMPVIPSKILAVQLQGDVNPVAAMIRKHYIAIYPDATKKFVDQLKLKQNVQFKNK